LAFSRDSSDEMTIRIGGVWRLRHGIGRDVAVARRELSGNKELHKVTFDASGLKSWDSSLLTLVAGIEDVCREAHIEIDRSGLPEGARRLLELASGGPNSSAEVRAIRRQGVFERVGQRILDRVDALRGPLAFLGNVSRAFARMLIGRARYRGVDFMEATRACGIEALGIVALISFLSGVILAFMGAVQLRQFGAAIYVANLVAIAMVREMGPMMTAVIMAGRTGAAFAAQLGTMKVRQEVEALETMGISPIEFLVLPRLVPLVLMMPLLALYSDFIGVFGGAAIGVGMLHLSLTSYLHISATSIYPMTFVGGVFKSFVYGILIGLAGCYQGMRCGNNAAAVGQATTSAVVNGIVMVVVACGMFAMVFSVLDI
jgi:phospholipid/cholesterol/gamma-HCH transport system permease protein